MVGGQVDEVVCVEFQNKIKPRGVEKSKPINGTYVVVCAFGAALFVVADLPPNRFRSDGGWGFAGVGFMVVVSVTISIFNGLPAEEKTRKASD